MDETRRKPTTRRQSPSPFDKWHRICYMPSCIDTAGHTKAFDYPVHRHGWTYQGALGGIKAEMFSSASGTRTDNTLAQSNALPTEPSWLPQQEQRKGVKAKIIRPDIYLHKVLSSYHNNIFSDKNNNLRTELEWSRATTSLIKE